MLSNELKGMSAGLIATLVLTVLLLINHATSLQATPFEVLANAYFPGHTEITIGGRKIDATGRPIFST